jgi:hypothetical protein
MRMIIAPLVQVQHDYHMSLKAARLGKKDSILFAAAVIAGVSLCDIALDRCRISRHHCLALRTKG